LPALLLVLPGGMQNQHMRSLLLLRHAQTENVRAAATDQARRLTPDGERQAGELGQHLRSGPTPLDLVLCSSAVRAQQTVQALRVGAPVVVSDRLYDAGGDEILVLIRELPDDVTHVLVVGHAPGLPALVHELADPATSDPAARATIEWRFPAGTMATLAVTGAWATLDAAALVSVHLP
jgi:phosphohistidine phosphatase